MNPGARETAASPRRRLDGRHSRRVRLAVGIAAVLPVVAVVYLVLPHVFPHLIPAWAYQGSWLLLVAMTIALGMLQLSVLWSYLDLRQELGRLSPWAGSPGQPAAARGSGDVEQAMEGLLASGRSAHPTVVVGELTRILRLVHQQAAQVNEQAARFEVINEELRRANLRLREMSLTDDLTEVGNRRNFELRIREELNRSTRFGHAFSLLLLDIDAFKLYNDEFGHLQGDAALRALGALMRSISREGDVPCRIGGEEFAFILPETSKGDAMALAERIRHGVEASIMAPDGSRALTVSIGLAAFPGDGKTQEDLLGAADEALYDSKRGGRNRVTAFSRKLGPAGEKSIA